MKIALINPPYRSEKAIISPTYPLGLGYIKKSCSDNGVKVDLFDFSCTKKNDEELIDRYRLWKYDLIGITTFTPTFKDTINFIKHLKQFNNNNQIVFGGHHADLLGVKILEDYNDVDFVLQGFGEESFPKLIKEIQGEMNFTCISGLIYRNIDGIKGNKIVIPKKLDDFNFPDRNDIIYDYPTGKLEETELTNLTISTSRGCPYRCNYCVLSEQNYWIERSSEDIVNEVIECFSDNNKYTLINFVDDNFFVKPQRAKNIIEEIGRLHPGIMFSFQTRADQIVKNSEFLKEISEKYDICIALGVESQSESVLMRYNKKNTPEIIKRLLMY